jgi:hypothetical protein
MESKWPPFDVRRFGVSVHKELRYVLPSQILFYLKTYLLEEDRLRMKDCLRVKGCFRVNEYDFLQK